MPGGERPMHSFETLTLAPIDKNMIQLDLLNLEEMAWLNSYHARVRREIAVSLEGTDRAWLEQATAAVG